MNDNNIDFRNEHSKFKDETILREAIFNSLKNDMDAFDAIGEMEPSPELKKKMDQAFARGIKAGTKNALKHSHKHRLIKIISFIAAVFFIVIIPSGIYVNASARTAVANFLIGNFSQFSTIKYDQNDLVCRPIGWDSMYYPLVVPDRFFYDKITISEQSDSIWYRSESGHSFSFSVFSSNLEVSFDTEDMIAQNMEISSYSATLYLSSDGIQNNLVIYLPEQFILISGNLTEKEIIKVGNNINGIS